MIGHHYWEFVEEPEAVRHEFIKLASERWPIGEVRRTAYRRSDGGLVSVLASSSPVKDEGERFFGMRTVIQNYEGIKQSDEKALDALRLSSVAEMAARLAHELNNPLASISAHTELILAEGAGEAITEDLESVKAEVMRTSNIIENLAHFAQTDPSAREHKDISEILEDAVGRAHNDFRAKGIQVTTHYSSDDTSTMVNERLLLHAIQNILANSVQALAGANGGGEISISLDREGDELGLTITDNGPGIPAEHLDRVFDPFFTTRPVGEGLGLGLSVAYGAVMQHGGEILAESVPAEGATFRILLPALRPYPDAEQRGTERPGSPDRAKRVLVIDDEAGLRRALARLLTSEGCEVDAASDGTEGWEKVQAAAYDHIFMDMRMPGMGGDELYQLIMDHDAKQASKVIFVTGDTLTAETQKTISESGNPAVDKPFLKQDLIRAMVRSDQFALE